MKVSQSRQEFLWYSYFGITKTKATELYKSNPKQLIFQCAKKAYQDIKPTLRFSGNDEVKQHGFRDEICRYISENILRIFRDKFYLNVCEEISLNIYKLASKSDILKPGSGRMESIDCENRIYGGQAMQWLSITLKYMRLMGFWERRFAAKKADLPIPIDHFVMERASKDLGVAFPRKDKDTRYCRYDENLSKPCETWTASEYCIAVGNIKRKLPDGVSCIDWAEKIWIDAANGCL